MSDLIVKVHTSREGILLAVCDSDLVGKKFETDKLQLDLTSRFYRGEETSEDKLREMMKSAYILNVVGEKSIGFMKKEGLVDDAGIIKIENIPHAQIVRVSK